MGDNSCSIPSSSDKRESKCSQCATVTVRSDSSPYYYCGLSIFSGHRNNDWAILSPDPGSDELTSTDSHQWAHSFTVRNQPLHKWMEKCNTSTFVNAFGFEIPQDPEESNLCSKTSWALIHPVCIQDSRKMQECSFFSGTFIEISYSKCWVYKMGKITVTPVK